MDLSATGNNDNNNNRKRSNAEIVIATAAIIGLMVSFFTGIRAYYVNEYRIDLTEKQLNELRVEMKKVRDDLQEVDHSVQRLLGLVIKESVFPELKDNKRR